MRSPKADEAIVIVVHRIPRFTACSTDELPQPWKGAEAELRLTTLTFKDGSLEHKVESGQLDEWTKSRPWGGQTVFTFLREQGKAGCGLFSSTEPSEAILARSSDADESAAKPEDPDDGESMWSIEVFQ